MIEPGERAPDFTLPDQDGNPVRLADLLREGPLVLYFYPADFTPGCTKEACTFRDMHGDISGAGYRVVGVSPQDPASHGRFRARYRLPFTLLADPHKQAIRAYGVDGPLGVGVRRATFVLDPDGTVRERVVADLRIGRHEALVREALGRP